MASSSLRIGCTAFPEMNSPNRYNSPMHVGKLPTSRTVDHGRVVNPRLDNACQRELAHAGPPLGERDRIHFFPVAPSGTFAGAIERLGKGQTVTRVALDLGYERPSAFIAMFRCTLGAPLGKYFQHLPT